MSILKEVLLNNSKRLANLVGFAFIILRLWYLRNNVEQNKFLL